MADSWQERKAQLLDHVSRKSVVAPAWCPVYHGRCVGPARCIYGVEPDRCFNTEVVHKAGKS